ncbi:MAG: KxYKxGKxW signal peptide domain-containing protein [Bacteroidales bacterium]|nr:KxYKxGKxW signal peptide domain-containing protein [Bacteroidales bacterium]MCF8403727.1 KxYKxGKxW signal peptide domain-containing protein [Bacteroidales bacterium]
MLPIGIIIKMYLSGKNWIILA